MWSGGSVGAAAQPLFIAPTTSLIANALILDGPFTNPGNTAYVNMTGLGVSSTTQIAATNSGRDLYSMPTPPPPGIVVSSGGNVPIRSVPYQIQWVDVDGNYSGARPNITAVITSGNQTVTLTPPHAPPWPIGNVPFLNNGKLFMAGY